MKEKIQNQNRNSIKIYDYDLFLKQTWRLIEKELSLENVKLIQNYERSMVNSSLSKGTRHKHLKMILSLGRLLDKNWEQVTKHDIEDLIFKIMNKYDDGNGKETNTTWDHKKVLKIFFRWVKFGSRNKDDVGDPLETKWIKIRKVQDKIVREDLLTETDRTRLLHACGENSRDRAIIDCHFEAGTRPGEILNLQIKHVKFDNYGAVIHVEGKTGARPVRLVKSTPNLANWIAVHPFKNNPDAPLWPILSTRNYGQPLSMASARKMLQTRCKKAEISKRIYLNLFRHSEATITANYMTEAQMRKRHGWSNESKMPARYVHLVDSDVDKAILAHYGLDKQEEKTQENLPKTCQICNTINSSELTNCVKCGKPLDVKAVFEIDQKFSDMQEKYQDLKKLLNGFSKQFKNLEKRIEQKRS